jgi:hypothetical protein
MAEYMVSFPAAILDDARDLLAALRAVAGYITGPAANLPASSIMLLHGPGGIGKTHAIVDHAISRAKRGLKSLVFFGEDFGHAEPWVTMATKLGFGPGVDRDQLFGMLDAAAEASGNYLVIYIDALNETPDRSRWRAWLPGLSAQIERYPYLKLCVSCRESYLRDAVPNWERIPSFLHNGFAGREFETCIRFFEHFGLDPPTTPLLQPEFANPMFLHLVCEAARDSGLHTLPLGQQGLTRVIGLFLRAKNGMAARALDYDSREDRVSAAIRLLIARIAETGLRHLRLTDAKQVVEEKYPSTSQSTSLFDQLERESLISIVSLRPDPLSEPEYRVRFSFERVGDHLLAAHYIEGRSIEEAKALFSDGGALDFAVKDDSAASENSGLLEALAMLLPELFNIELTSVADRLDRYSIVLPAILGSLSWRDPVAVGMRTQALVEEALGRTGIALLAMETILLLSPRPGHRLNADYLHRHQKRQSLTSRDPFWAYALHSSFLAEGIVHRLIDWALRSELRTLSPETVRLWAIALAWFCAAPDRRIRDRATKGIVKLFVAHPSVTAQLLGAFADCDDDYVVERVLMATYGALLLSRDTGALREIAVLAHRTIFQNEVSFNAVIRDHSRLIIEYALDLNAIEPKALSANFRSPYSSEWPLRIPSEEELQPLAEDRDRFPRAMVLDQKINLAFGTDFARYIVEPRVTNSFDLKPLGMDQAAIFRWFLKKAVEMGYPGSDDQCARYDYMVLAKYGGGRAKPVWAERLGKKYYWILLHRLVGQVADNVPRRSFWEQSGPDTPSTRLQALDLRDIDPTDLRAWSQRASGEDAPLWKAPAPYIFNRGRSADEEWVLNNDLSGPRHALLSDYPSASARWMIIDEDVTWNSPPAEASVQKYPYRRVVRYILSGYVPSTAVSKLTRTLRQNRFHVDELRSLEAHDYRGYLGEYPSRLSYRERRRADGLLSPIDVQGVPVDPSILKQLKGGEWEYDCSEDGRSKSLTVPSPGIIESESLRWDGDYGWLGNSRGLQAVAVMSPDGDASALLVQKPLMEIYLKRHQLALVWFVYECKQVISGSMGIGDFVGELERRSAYVFSGGKIRLVGAHTTTRPSRAQVRRPKRTQSRKSASARPKRRDTKSIRRRSS